MHFNNARTSLDAKKWAGNNLLLENKVMGREIDRIAIINRVTM